jgi:hypothetical protein
VADEDAGDGRCDHRGRPPRAWRAITPRGRYPSRRPSHPRSPRSRGSGTFARRARRPGQAGETPAFPTGRDACVTTTAGHGVISRAV